MPRPTPFQHPYKHYAKLYSVNLNTIKLAIKQGLNLDDTESCKLRFIKQLTAAGTPPQTPAPGQTAAPHQRTRKAATGVLGLQGALHRLRDAESQAHADYEAAAAAGEGVKKAHYQKEWIALVKALREAEEANPDVAEQNKKSVPVDDLEKQMSKTFSIFKQQLLNLTSRVENDLVGKDVIGIREVLNQEIQEIINSLYSCKWFDSE